MEKKYNLLKNTTFQFNSMPYSGCTAWILIDSVLELWEGYEEEILDLHWLSAQITNKKHITLYLIEKQSSYGGLALTSEAIIN